VCNNTDRIKMELKIFELIVTLVIGACIIAVLASVLINFLNANKTGIKREQKSIVATGTMMGFFITYYAVLRFQITMIEFNNLYFRIPAIVICLLIMVLGAYVNITGRLKLGKNWSDHIKIYKNQSLIRTGVYKHIRHPLYASLIWMFYAGSIIFMNPLAFVLNTFIFVPFMYYRAKQEEALLQKTFKEYSSYKNNTWMFFPKVI